MVKTVLGWGSKQREGETGTFELCLWRLGATLIKWASKCVFTFDSLNTRKHLFAFCFTQIKTQLVIGGLKRQRWNNSGDGQDWICHSPDWGLQGMLFSSGACLLVQGCPHGSSQSPATLNSTAIWCCFLGSMSTCTCVVQTHTHAGKISLHIKIHF